MYLYLCCAIFVLIFFCLFFLFLNSYLTTHILPLYSTLPPTHRPILPLPPTHLSTSMSSFPSPLLASEIKALIGDITPKAFNSNTQLSNNQGEEGGEEGVNEGMKQSSWNHAGKLVGLFVVVDWCYLFLLFVCFYCCLFVCLVVYY